MAVDRTVILNYGIFLFQKQINPAECKSYQQLGNLTCSNSELEFDQSSPISDVTPSREPQHFPKVGDMKYWILMAFALIFIRKIVERFAFKPLGKRLRIQDYAMSPAKIPCRCPSAFKPLEAAYLSKNESDLLELSSRTGLTLREIERWMRRRRAIGKPSKLVKFTESGWRFTSYVTSVILGFASSWHQPFLWDIRHCWIDYPNHELSNGIFFYYLFGSGLYISFLLTHFVDVKRKDFREMFIHHIVTITLLTLAYLLNTTRGGLLTLLLHDCSDIFLELAKMANYAKKDDLATGIFVVFVIVWTLTRLVLFPRKIIYEAIWQQALVRLPNSVGYPFLALFLVLFGLHVFWTYFIVKMAFTVLTSGNEKKKDSRSSSESSMSDSDVPEVLRSGKAAKT